MFKAFAANPVVFSLCGGLAALFGLTSCGGGGSSAMSSCPPQTAPALTCSPGVSPASPVITDFTMDDGWCTTSGKWGAVGNLVGGLFAYNGPGRVAPLVPITSSVSGGAMHLKGDVAAADYAGGGLAFDACVNTTMYSGVRFALGGDAASCSVQVQLQTYSQQAVVNRGGCDMAAGASCYQFPKTAATLGATNTIMWSQLESTGLPATASAIAAELVGLQFQFEASSGTNCMNVDLTIDDVQFVP